jgi:hypothetical protein
MAELEALLLQLPARGIRAVLDELVRARAAGSPCVTLQLGSGHTVRGWVLALEDGPGSRAPTLLLRGASPAGAPADDVVYLDPGSIETLTVHAASTALGLLSFGAIEEKPGESAPTRLQLRRRATELKAVLAALVGRPFALDVDWAGIPDSEPCLANLARLMEELVSAIGQIRAEHGNDAVAGAIRTVRLAHAPVPGVSRQGETLVLSANLEKGRQGRLSELRAAIEKLL